MKEENMEQPSPEVGLPLPYLKSGQRLISVVDRASSPMQNAKPRFLYSFK